MTPTTPDATQEHSNAQVIRNFFAVFGTADEAQLRRFCQEDIRWHFPGASPIANTWEGIAGITQGIRAISFALRPGPGGFELLEVAANDRIALSVHRDFTEDPTNPLDLRYVLFAHMRDGKIAEAWELPFDQYVNDRFYAIQARRYVAQQATSPEIATP